MKKFIMVLFLECIISNQLFAAEAHCTGTVDAVGAHTPDILIVKLSNTNHIQICAFTTANKFNDITPELCKLFASIASQAKATNSNLGLVIDNTPSSDCLSVPDWSQAQVRYLGN